VTDVHQPGDAPARPSQRADDARFRPGARRRRAPWPTYGTDVEAAVDPLRRTLGPDLRGRHDAGDGHGRRDEGTRQGTAPSARDAASPGRRRASSGAGTPRRKLPRGAFWAALRPGLLLGAAVVAAVLVLARAATGLDGESTVVVAPYGVTLVVTPLLAVVCATGWAVRAVRLRSARRNGERAACAPRPWLRRTTTALGVGVAVVVVVPLWVGFSA
jgi:hypothetical protein